MIEIIISVIAFMIGTVLGSFFTLAVYRIPLKQNITHERSYCPKCNHKLKFLDLIPVLSYVFLKGKCRYCSEKIRPRYLILELCSGFIFMLYILSLKIDYINFQIGDMINCIFGVIYLSVLAITAGINLEKRNITKSLITFTTVLSLIYMLYLYVLGANMYRYIIYLVIIISLLLINKLKQNDTLDIIIYILLILLYIGTTSAIVSIILTFMVIAIKNLYNIIKKKKETKVMAIATIFSIITIIIMILQNYITVR